MRGIFNSWHEIFNVFKRIFFTPLQVLNAIWSWQHVHQFVVQKYRSHWVQFILLNCALIATWLRTVIEDGSWWQSVFWFVCGWFWGWNFPHSSGQGRITENLNKTMTMDENFYFNLEENNSEEDMLQTSESPSDSQQFSTHLSDM